MAISETVIVTGPESTGKTTIAEKLASSFKGVLLPEYARDYINQLEQNYTYLDIENIAVWQSDNLSELIKKTNRPIIADTYLIITKIWFIWFSGKYPKWLDKRIKETSKCLYLLCQPDIEWVADGVRENGGENRIKLYNLYKAELEKHNLHYKTIEGKGEKRNKLAINSVKTYLSR